MSATALATSQNGARSSVALVDLSVPQLTEACRMLEQCQARYDKLSGICATMRGFVLIEVKAKLAHGQFLPWLTTNYGKTRKTAAEDMRVARECAKCRPTVTFEALGRDLAATIGELEQANIDLEHPLVKEIENWVGGRTRYQLLLEFGPERGGDTSGSRKKLSPEEEHKKFLDDAKNEFAGTFEGLDRLVDSGTWKAPSITDPMLDAALEVARDFVKQASAWRKLTSADRRSQIADLEGAK